jgi:hypothetical protein
MIETELLKIMIQYAKNHKEGFTAWLSDYNLTEYIQENGHRYIVAIETVITLDDSFKPILIYHNSIKPYIHYGGWYDKENKVYLIEKILLFETLKFAMRTAREHNQRFIYDLKEKKEIKVNEVI